MDTVKFQQTWNEEAYMAMNNGGNGTMETCGYPGSTAYGSKKLNPEESRSWQHLATVACEKEGQGLSPAAGWCHSMVAPAPVVPCLCSHQLFGTQH